MQTDHPVPKLGFLVTEGQQFDKWAALAGAEGLSLELIFFEKDPAAVLPAALVREECARHGVSICAVGLWRANVLDPDPAARNANRALFLAAADYAAAVGSSVFYSDAGQAPGGIEENVAAYATAFPPLLEQVAARGLRYCTYMGHNNFLNSTEAVRAFCRAVPGVGLKADPVGLIRNLKADPLAFYAEFSSRIGHMHAKDLLRVGDREIEPPVGYGQIPWAQLLGLLYEDDYQGHVVIEPHGPKWNTPDCYERNVRLSLPLLRALVR